VSPRRQAPADTTMTSVPGAQGSGGDPSQAVASGTDASSAEVVELKQLVTAQLAKVAEQASEIQGLTQTVRRLEQAEHTASLRAAQEVNQQRITELEEQIRDAGTMNSMNNADVTAMKNKLASFNKKQRQYEQEMAPRVAEYDRMLAIAKEEKEGKANLNLSTGNGHLRGQLSVQELQTQMAAQAKQIADLLQMVQSGSPVAVAVPKTTAARPKTPSRWGVMRALRRIMPAKQPAAVAPTPPTPTVAGPAPLAPSFVTTGGVVLSLEFDGVVTGTLDATAKTITKPASTAAKGNSKTDLPVIRNWSVRPYGGPGRHFSRQDPNTTLS